MKTLLPKADEGAHTPASTGLVTPPGVDADAVRRLIQGRFDLSPDTVLGMVKGRLFGVGPLGDCNDLALVAALSGAGTGLRVDGVTPAAAALPPPGATFQQQRRRSGRRRAARASAWPMRTSP